jgi:hypothetical protein
MRIERDPSHIVRRFNILNSSSHLDIKTGVKAQDCGGPDLSFDVIPTSVSCGLNTSLNRNAYRHSYGEWTTDFGNPREP